MVHVVIYTGGIDDYRVHKTPGRTVQLDKPTVICLVHSWEDCVWGLQNSKDYMIDVHWLCPSSTGI